MTSMLSSPAFLALEDRSTAAQQIPAIILTAP